MTGKGTGAISTIQIFGDSAEEVIKKVFKPTAAKQVKLKTGRVILGTITDGDNAIDQVTVGCEENNSFAINCHGNPLIVEMIMKLLQRHGVKLLTAEQLLTKILSADKSPNTIAVEAKLTQAKAKTIEGTKIITNQIDSGLSKTARRWLRQINEIPLKEITASAAQILKNSKTARLLIAGCTAILTGPPNTGKSTLLNFLAGRQKAIVTDIKGTTRDWVSAQCQIGSLSVELIDTAGLGRTIPVTLEEEAQKRSFEILEKADLVLLVLDNNQPAEQIDRKLLKKIAGRKILTVLNKSDLPAELDAEKLPPALSEKIEISAKEGAGIKELIKKIREFTGVDSFDLHQPVCFTSRQKELLEQLITAKSTTQAASIITELLNGQVSV